MNMTIWFVLLETCDIAIFNIWKRCDCSTADNCCDYRWIKFRAAQTPFIVPFYLNHFLICKCSATLVPTRAH